MTGPPSPTKVPRIRILQHSKQRHWPGTSKWNAIEHRLFSHITLNWRGRPLTSHEVVINTIAATTTRTGLRVHAQLDTDPYPTGIEVSDEQIAAVPITRHRFHGDWNYTLHPAPTTPTRPGPTSKPQDLLFHDLSDPELTGISRRDLKEMIRALDPVLQLKREQTLFARRGGRPSLTPGTGVKAKLTPAERILVTVLHQRKLATHDLLGELFHVTAMTTSRAVRDVLPVLTAHGYQIGASTARFHTPADITAFLAHKTANPNKKIKPAC